MNVFLVGSFSGGFNLWFNHILVGGLILGFNHILKFILNLRGFHTHNVCLLPILKWEETYFSLVKFTHNPTAANRHSGLSFPVTTSVQLVQRPADQFSTAAQRHQPSSQAFHVNISAGLFNPVSAAQLTYRCSCRPVQAMDGRFVSFSVAKCVLFQIEPPNL